MLLYENLSRSESDKDSTQFAHGLSKGAALPYQWPHRKTAPPDMDSSIERTALP